jgi:hypothetical protein
MSLKEIDKGNSLKSLKKFSVTWNNRFPFDRWWRLKYNIPFNSSAHREMNMIDIRIAYEEEKIYERYFEEQKVQEEGDKIYKETGQWLKRKELSEDEKDDIFDNLDVGAFNQEEDIVL